MEKHNLPDVRLVNFDFHKECKGMKYENLSRLMRIVSDELPTMGYFHVEFTPISKDQGGSSAASDSQGMGCIVVSGARVFFRS